jgi:Chaperone of endosialidase
MAMSITKDIWSSVAGSKIVQRASNQLTRSLLLIGLALTWAALSPARAVTPAPDGGYANNNTAEGTNALASLTTGFHNTATGAFALGSNTQGGNNTANGVNALYFNTTGFNNTANGLDALAFNTTGGFNAANGYQALFSNTTGINNTASGSAALASNTTGSGNIAIGKQAGVNLTTGSNNIDIGNVGLAGESNTVHIGKQGTQKATFIAGVFGTAVSGSTVVVNSTGKLGVATSSARFKQNIKPMDKASEAILALKPVSFRYKKEIDQDSTQQFGLIAEEVEKVNPQLVGRDENGRVNTVRYDAVNAMLLNEFLKEHRNVAEQQSTIAELKTTVAQQQKQIEAFTSIVQNVSDQIALSKPAPQLVANP